MCEERKQHGVILVVWHEVVVDCLGVFWQASSLLVRETIVKCLIVFGFWEDLVNVGCVFFILLDIALDDLDLLWLDSLLLSRGIVFIIVVFGCP